MMDVMTIDKHCKINKARQADIVLHLKSCEFDPPLETRINIEKYAEKICNNAIRLEYWDELEGLVGLVAMYINSSDNPFAYITNVSILDNWRGKGIASHLLSSAISYASSVPVLNIDLEVFLDNRPAISLYRKFGFTVLSDKDDLLVMRLHVKKPVTL